MTRLIWLAWQFSPPPRTPAEERLLRPEIILPKRQDFIDATFRRRRVTRSSGAAEAVSRR
jgi:hypothetical protein